MDTLNCELLLMELEDASQETKLDKHTLLSSVIMLDHRWSNILLIQM